MLTFLTADKINNQYHHMRGLSEMSWNHLNSGEFLRDRIEGEYSKFICFHKVNLMQRNLFLKMYQTFQVTYQTTAQIW